MSTLELKRPDTGARRVKVLFVDDSIHDYRMLAGMAQGESGCEYDFQWAKNASEARSLLERFDYEVVAVDYNLGLDYGTELIAELSKEHPLPAYILVTGNKDPEVYRKGIDAGASSFVEKGKECGAVFNRAAQYSVERKRNENALALANASKNWLMGLLENDIGEPIVALNEALANIVREGNRMSKDALLDLVENAYSSSSETALASSKLLEWGRSTQGALQPYREMVDVGAIVEQVIRLFAPSVDEKGIVVRRRGSFPMKVYVDHYMMSSVVRNLFYTCIRITAARKAILVDSEAIGKKLRVSFNCLGGRLPKGALDSRAHPRREGSLSELAEQRKLKSSLHIASHMLDLQGCSLRVDQGVNVIFSFELPTYVIE